MAAALAALAPTLLLTPGSACANPATSVLTPAITEGEHEVELQFGAQRLRDGGSATGIALSYAIAPKPWWAIEFGVKGQRESGARFGYDAWEVEQRFALTEPGRYPVDLGLLFEVERPKNRDEGWELRYGPLLQTQWGALQANLNLLFERHLHAAEPPRAEFGYQWQLRWRADPTLDWGAQGFGETGPWRHWNPRDEQSHQLGPALFGRIKTSPGAALKYDAALLFGTGGSAPRRAVRARLEYEFF
jgi:hypothetical protein